MLFTGNNIDPTHETDEHSAANSVAVQTANRTKNYHHFLFRCFFRCAITNDKRLRRKPSAINASLSTPTVVVVVVVVVVDVVGDDDDVAVAPKCRLNEAYLETQHKVNATQHHK